LDIVRLESVVNAGFKTEKMTKVFGRVYCSVIFYRLVSYCKQYNEKTTCTHLAT
jgi:hypothetical protein